MKRKNCLYLIVMADLYELPIAVFDSVLSISLALKVSPRAINYAIKEHRKVQKNFFIEFVQDGNNLEIA